MKRIALLCMGLALGAANAAEAQLTMQMSNGWSFTFAGNVNAFLIYQRSKDAAGATSGKDLSFGTGLLPAFAVFDAKGKEENLDLGVHFGFAPQVETGGHFASFFGDQAAGAQIDMRQVYLTAGGTWGSLLIGKELGVYQRGNILTDMTLLGVGVGGGGRGTALGRIGYGYLYTDFRPQLTYTSPSGRPASISIGLFEGIGAAPYEVIELPRVEAEFNYNTKFGENSNFKLFLNGAAQTAKNGVSGSTSSLTSAGGGAGISIDVSGFAITGSGFFAKGMGSLFMGDACCGVDATTGADNARIPSDGVDVAGDGRNSFGYIGQIVYSSATSKFGIGGSFGENHLRRSDADKALPGAPDAEILKRRAIVGQITYKWSKSLRWVAEYGHIDGYSDGSKTSKSDQGSLGMMLFF
jgi:hypothetical protein